MTWDKDDSARANRELYQRRMAERTRVDGRWFHPGAPHGTSPGYVSWGCRCDPCVEAGRETRQRRLLAVRAGRQAIPDRVHGTLAGHNGWGCRCGRCTQAKAAYDKRRRS